MSRRSWHATHPSAFSTATRVTCSALSRITRGNYIPCFLARWIHSLICQDLERLSTIQLHPDSGTWIISRNPPQFRWKMHLRIWLAFTHVRHATGNVYTPNVVTLKRTVANKLVHGIPQLTKGQHIVIWIEWSMINGNTKVEWYPYSVICYYYYFSSILFRRLWIVLHLFTREALKTSTFPTISSSVSIGNIHVS